MSRLDRVYDHQQRAKVIGTPARARALCREHRSIYWGYLVDKIEAEIAEQMARGGSSLLLHGSHGGIVGELEMMEWVHHALAARLRALGWPRLELTEDADGHVTLSWEWPV